MDQKEVSNDFWYSIQAGTFPGTWNIVTACVTFYNHLTGALVVPLSSEVTIRGIRLVVNNGSGSLGTENYNALTGDDEQPSMPIDVAAIVRKITTTISRASQGRWYLPGLGQDLADESYLSSAGIVAFTNLAAALQLNVVDQSITWQASHYNRKLNVLEAIISCPVVADLATRRRRRGPF
jgi:hypothetical protein